MLHILYLYIYIYIYIYYIDMSDSVESPLSPHQDTPPPPQLPPSYQVPDADPGLVIVFKAAPDVHNCMGLPSVANLTPPLQQGMSHFVMICC